MPRVEEQTHLDPPPEAVHAFLQDLDRYPEWIAFTDEVTRLERPGDGVVGTRYWEQGTGGESEWEIVAYDEGRREVHEGDIGIATVRIEMTMAPDGDGTAYRHVIEYEMEISVLGWLIDKLVLNRKMCAGLRETVANLERLVDERG